MHVEKTSAETLCPLKNMIFPPPLKSDPVHCSDVGVATLSSERQRYGRLAFCALKNAPVAVPLIYTRVADRLHQGRRPDSTGRTSEGGARAIAGRCGTGTALGAWTRRRPSPARP